MNTCAIYNNFNSKLSFMNTTAISSELRKPETRAAILLAAVAFHVPLLLGLSSRQRHNGNPVLRFLLWGVSATYFPLMTYTLSYLTTYISSAGEQATRVLVAIILVQFLRVKAHMAALAVAAVASPAAAVDDGDLKIRPSTQSLINTFWVAGLVIYKEFTTQGRMMEHGYLPVGAVLLFSPLWALGACRTVLRFAAFQRAMGSFELGRNVQLIDGYMLQLREEGQPQQLPAVPRLIVTGERNQDVVESPLGYHVKRSSLQGEGSSRLVTLDRVWSSDLQPLHKDLCLSFALFKCLRRRFAGYQLAAEAGSSWAFRFVCDGLLGRENDHERVFKVIATELSFASDLFHSPLPVASLSTTAAALDFLFSLIILPLLLSLAALILQIYAKLLISSFSSSLDNEYKHEWFPLRLLLLVLALVNAGTEISEMVASVRSNWARISIIGHIIRTKHRCSRRFLAWLLLRCKAPEFWKDEIGQTQMLDLFAMQQPCACSRQFSPSRQLLSLSRSRRNHHFHHHKVPLVVMVKEAILKSLRGGGGQLSYGTAAIRRQAFAAGNDITWACRDGGGVVTATDAILVWHIATTLFDIKCRSASTTPSSRHGHSAASGSSSPSTPVANDVACCLSRYCMYLVAEAPDLLPDKPAWITRLYKTVMKRIQEAPKCSGDESRMYQHLVDTFSGENSESHFDSHEVLIKGAKLGKQLVKEAEMRRRRQRSEGGGGGGEAGGAKAEDEIWEFLSDFWSEVVLYLAPSDNVKVHIEALQRGGEFITLLWALLQHAGITSRPVELNFTACVLLSTEDPDDAIAGHNC